MGSGKHVPAWVGEIHIMEKMGWTERELYEDVSLETILKMNYLNEMRAKADGLRRGRQGKVATSPDVVREIEFRA